MARTRLNGHKDKRESGGFIAIPHIVIRSRGYAELSPISVKLLNDLLAQYNGKNNGDLSCTWKVMKERCWKSNDTLYKARDELLNGGWIIVTRQGGRHKCSLYAFTFYGIDDCKGKLDVQPTRTPPGNWKNSVLRQAVQCTPPRVSIAPEINH